MSFPLGLAVGIAASGHHEPMSIGAVILLIAFIVFLIIFIIKTS